MPNSPALVAFYRYGDRHRIGPVTGGDSISVTCTENGAEVVILRSRVRLVAEG